MRVVLTWRAASFAALVAFSGSTQAVEPVDVKVIDRQDNANNYTYAVPGFTTSTGVGTANCNVLGNTANCTGVANGSSISTPGYVGSYQVRGATLSLLLPDGRVAVVNCEAKVNWTEWSNPSMYRSCRVPLVTSIKATFSGDKAHLSWPVSIDGKTMRNETYKILAILDKKQE